MAVSRPLLLVLMGVLLATASLFAARGARETAAQPAPTSVSTQSVAPVTPGPQNGGPAGARDKSPRADADRDGPVDEGNPAENRDGKPADDAGNGKRTEARDGGREQGRGDRRIRPEVRPADIPEGVPTPVGRALAQKRVVVLFFGQGGADDAATQDAVAAVRDIKGVSVFTDSIRRLAKYRAVTSPLGIAQAPAVVVVGKDRQAQVIQGFVDAGTLRQTVVDAR